MPILCYILLALLALLLLSGFYTFWVACARRKELPWMVEEEIKKTSYGKFYDNIVLGDRFLKEYNAQPLYMNTFDGLKLHAMWVPARNPKGTILFVHGYRSNKLIDFSLAYDFYHNMGMNILTPDQRAIGKSEGKFITFGVKECKDIQCWIDYHNKTFGEYPIILSGLSMGATTVLNLADAELPKNVKGIIADSGFTSANEIISSVFRRVTHLPAVPCIWIADLFARLIAGFSLYEKDTRNALKNSKHPVFMVHGVADGYVPCEMTKLGYDACSGAKELLLVEGADHGLSFIVEKERYIQMVTDFLKDKIRTE